MTAPILATPRSGWGGRGYRIPGRGEFIVNASGKKVWRQEVYPSVTTLNKQIAKPGLIQWAVDQTAAFAVMNAAHIQGLSEEAAWRFLRFYFSRDRDLDDMPGREIRLYHESVKDDAAELGTNIHEWIEADIDGLVGYPPLYAIETEQMIEAWLAWFAEHEVISHRSEFTCVNDTLGVAGTADADWTITCLHDPEVVSLPDGDFVNLWCMGEEPGPYRTLVDVKSARYTWREHGYQLAALASCNAIMRQVPEGTEGAQKAEKTERGKKIRSWWVEDAPPTWDRYALLHIRPDDLDPKGARIGRFCMLLDRTDDMDLYKMGFEGALLLAKSQKYLLDRQRSRGYEENPNEVAFDNSNNEQNGAD